MGAGAGGIAAELDMTFSNTREGNIRPSVVSDDIRGIDDNSARAGHGEVVPGDVAARHACEGESFAWGKMGFLEADNVVGFGKVIQG